MYSAITTGSYSFPSRERLIGTETKDDRLQLRLDAESKSVLQRAAGYRHKTVSQFVLATMLEDAEKVIRENELVTSSYSDRRIFYAAPTNPPEPNAVLR